MKNKTNQQDKPGARHTLNNLIATISISAEALLKGMCGPLNGEQKKYIKTILLQSKKMKEAVKSLQKP